MTTKVDEARTVDCSRGADKAAIIVWCSHQQVAHPAMLELFDGTNFLGKVQLYCTDFP